MNIGQCTGVLHLISDIQYGYRFSATQVPFPSLAFIIAIQYIYLWCVSFCWPKKYESYSGRERERESEYVYYHKCFMCTHIVVNCGKADDTSVHIDRITNVFSRFLLFTVFLLTFFFRYRSYHWNSLWGLWEGRRGQK